MTRLIAILGAITACASLIIFALRATLPNTALAVMFIVALLIVPLQDFLGSKEGHNAISEVLTHVGDLQATVAGIKDKILPGK